MSEQDEAVCDLDALEKLAGDTDVDNLRVACEEIRRSRGRSTPQHDPGARIQIREAIAYLRRQQHACTGRYCEHCLITNNLDDARRWLFPHDPLGEIDPESPYAGSPGKR